MNRFLAPRRALSVVSALCLSLVGVIGGSAVATAAPGGEGISPQTIGQTYYVSAGGSDSNDGLSEDAAFGSLAPVNELTLGPGDKVLLRRGDVFNDQAIHVKGSGFAEALIEISAYGDESKPLPVINTNGAGQWYQDFNMTLDNPTHKNKGWVSSSILLKDVEYIRVSDLEITNKRTEDAPGNYNDTDTMDRTGVAGIAENAGTVHTIILEGLYVHDVEGNVYNKHMANGGIYFLVHKPLDEGATGIARFDDVQVLNNRVENVNRWGIGVGYSAYWDKFTTGALPDSVMEQYGQSNVVVRGNYVFGAGGDSITVFYADRPLVEYNVSQNGSRQINWTDYAHTGAGRVAAGIWAWKTKNAVFQYNEAFNTLNGAQGNNDAQAWDADYGDGTLYQYNYSHGNTGGTVMFCGYQAVNSTFRFNIAQNDMLGALDFAGNPTAHVYNNTFYFSNGEPVLGRHLPANGGGTIENNIFYNSGQAVAGNWYEATSTLKYNNNLYYNYTNAPIDSDGQRVSAGEQVMVDPGSGPAQSKGATFTGLDVVNARSSETTAFDGYRLLEESAAANTGKQIEDQNGFALDTDFFGDLITGVPDIGAIQIAGDAPEIPELSGDSYSWVKDFQNEAQGPVWFAQYDDGSGWANIRDYDSTYPNWAVDVWYGPGIDYRSHELPSPDDRAGIHGLLSDPPARDGRTAIVFRAPRDGVVDLTTMTGEPYLRQAGNKGGTVKLSLLLGDEVLQSVTLSDSLTPAEGWKDLVGDEGIRVFEGDYLRIVAESVGRPSAPSLHISPVFTYQDEPETQPDADSFSWVKDYKNYVQGPNWFAQQKSDGDWSDIAVYDPTYPNWVVNTYYGPGLDYPSHSLPDPAGRQDIHGLLSAPPNSNIQTAMAFKASRDGVVNLTVGESEPYLRQTGNKGGTVLLSLFLNDEVLQSVTLSDSLATAEGWKDLVGAEGVEVVKGDYIRIVAKAVDNPSRGSLHISPVVTYQEDEVAPDVEVVPGVPEFDDENWKYTIPETEGVTYLVDGVVTAAGTYDAGFEAAVVVTAEAEDGYVLAEDATDSWSHTFPAEPEDVEVVPGVPEFDDENWKYTIPETEGVTYLVDGVVTAAGTYDAGFEATVVVTAEAQDGYVLAEDATDSWSHTFPAEPVEPTEPFRVVFDLSEGEGDFEVLTVGEDGKVTIPLTVPARDGYKFLGWLPVCQATMRALPAPLAEPALLQPGETFEPLGDVTLVAQWQKLPVGPTDPIDPTDPAQSGATDGQQSGVDADADPSGKLPTTGNALSLFALGGVALLLGGAVITLLAARSRRA